MCCNNAYVNRNHEFITPENAAVTMAAAAAQRNKSSKKANGYTDYEDKENMNSNMLFDDQQMMVGGEMHITDRKDNHELVKHIRTTSASVNSRAVFDAQRIKQLAIIVD